MMEPKADLDSTSADLCPGCGKPLERRDHAAQVHWTRRLNKILVYANVIFAACIIGLIGLTFSLWERQKERQMVLRLQCRTLWVQGKSDPFCIEWEQQFRALDAERIPSEGIQDPRYTK